MAEPMKGDMSALGGVSALEERVERTVSKYEGIREPCAIIYDLFRAKEDHDLFVDVVTQQLMLIKSRSQAWEDGHVTVWDKALLVLSKNGTDVGSLGALELYIEEFIGVNPNSRGRYAGDTVAQHISVRSLRGELFRPVNVEQTSPENVQPRPRSQNVKLETSQALAKTGSLSPRPKHEPESPDDKKLVRILDIYSKAKNDFLELDESNNSAKCHAARFLRDTAENALTYLHSRHLMNHPMVPELEDMFDQAKRDAIKLSGGKKRRFEIDEDPNNKHPQYPDQYRRRYRKHHRPGRA